MADVQTKHEQFFKFDAQAKTDTFRKVFDGGLPMWEKLAEVLDKHMPKPAKILSVGDGPGEPGCFLAQRYGCPTITSDSVVPMVEAAKKRVTAKGLGNVEGMVLDMQDLSSIDSASVDLVSSAHAYPFAADKPKAFAEALRVLKPGGAFGAIVWVSFELLPFAGAQMAAVTGETPAPPPAGAPPPVPMSLRDPAESEKLLKEAGFEVLAGAEEQVISFDLADREVAVKYCALPIWDKLSELEASGKVPDAWKKYEAAWPETAKAKGHLKEDGTFSISGVYRVILAKKPA